MNSKHYRYYWYWTTTDKILETLFTRILTYLLITTLVYILNWWWSGYMVYKWGFPFLDYPLDVLFSWIRRLSLYNWFCLHLHSIYDICSWWLVHVFILSLLSTVYLLDLNTWSTDIPAHLCLFEHATWFLRTRWIAFWQPRICMSRSQSLNVGKVSVADQSGAAEA